MSISNKKELKTKTVKTLGKLRETIVDYLDIKTAEKLLYWLNTWGNNYLRNEKTFNYNALKYYNRGNIVLANLGFKVGSEQGGLHYCLVIENDNSKSNRTLMVVPLRSLKDSELPEHVDDRYEIFLGYGIFKDYLKQVKADIMNLQLKKMELTESTEINQIDRDIKYKKKELSNLEKGSVALLNQICSLSKLRIYKPKRNDDILSSFCLDDDLMDKIDNKIIELYLNPSISKKMKKNTCNNSESVI
ncbi:type II toxin-antitoxin system PemK/MazF family toxin [Vallitalea guaymasensis]|uniref:type II toxin-antitoxin system PemK/MazF family toxin n=1 Tax=Vallitalea guaymasensis TaxID=1185412 RepID=UPI0023559ACC|nr:type II toxin-antitoxin system PemK/MazF family toxin [Vallitalea guaymasensis]